MVTVKLKYIQHRGKECIAIVFPFDRKLIRAMRSLENIAWSKTHGCWYIPHNTGSIQSITNVFARLAIVDQSGLRSEREPGVPGIHGSPVLKATSLLGSMVSKRAGGRPANIHPVNEPVLIQMRQELVLKAYSRSTIKTYMNEMRALLATIGNIPADELQPEHLKRYLIYCSEKLKLQEHTLNSRLNALKFYYEQVLKKEKFFWEIPRPKRPMQLPKLLNRNELTRLFNAAENKKHKALLFTVYSSGMRVSEVTHLKLADIDSERMQIHIERAKGKKDRYVNLSPALLGILRKYISEIKPRPRVYLFESEQTGTAYPSRTVQQIFQNAKKKAGIIKEVGIHSLRHSYATHLLDKGTDIHYIKELLGHHNIKTTERYLHVSQRKLSDIGSPFDDLWNEETIKW
jgi:site-specific recombinase XerD